MAGEAVNITALMMLNRLEPPRSSADRLNPKIMDQLVAMIKEAAGESPQPAASEQSEQSEPSEKTNSVDTIADGNGKATSDSKAERAKGVQERLRGLTATQMIKVAKHGELTERTQLERIYGKAVWDPLLRNPRISPPEVARIARMGSLPKPLLEQIVGNNSWLQNSQVRRALLTNPKLRGEAITRVLRTVPKSELRLMNKQTVYPPAVRSAAAKLAR